MATTLLDRTAHGLRGNVPGSALGLGSVMVLMAAAAGLYLWTRPDAAAHGSAPTSMVDAHLAQVPGLPAGATECPLVYKDLQGTFDRGAKGTPATSCGFVEQTRMTYDTQPRSAGPQQLRVISPATYKWYDLMCSPTGSYVTCTGGAAVVIYLYEQRT